jgi:hypothetical protein
MQSILQNKSSKFTSLYTGDSTAFKFYSESIDLRIKAEWKSAGDKLVKSAEKYATLKMFLEAATIYCEAAECYSKVDKSEAQFAYSMAVKVYCDLNRYENAGRIERKIAEIHNRLKHYDDAALHYRKAANFLMSEQEQSDFCLERSAEALILSNECNQPHLMYENIALSCNNTNLRLFQANDKLLMAILCLFGVPVILKQPVDKGLVKSPNKKGIKTNKPEIQAMLSIQYHTKYDDIRDKISEYETFTTTWKCSKERLLAHNLLSLRQENKYDEFIDHVYHWNNVRPWNDVALRLLKVPIKEMQDRIEQQEAAKTAAAEAVKKAAALAEEGSDT